MQDDRDDNAVKYAIFIVVTHKDKMSEQQTNPQYRRKDRGGVPARRGVGSNPAACVKPVLLPGYPMDNTRSDDNENIMWLCTSLI
jgi:hypothetical protein